MLSVLLEEDPRKGMQSPDIPQSSAKPAQGRASETAESLLTKSHGNGGVSLGLGAVEGETDINPVTTELKVKL